MALEQPARPGMVNYQMHHSWEPISTTFRNTAFLQYAGPRMKDSVRTRLIFSKTYGKYRKAKKWVMNLLKYLLRSQGT